MNETSRPESSSPSLPPHNRPKIDDLAVFHTGTYIRTAFRAALKTADYNIIFVYVYRSNILLYRPKRCIDNFFFF